MERGHGGGHTLDTWLRVAAAMGRPLHLAFDRDRSGETRDAGHLGIQELVLRVAAPHSDGAFELRLPRTTGRHSTDVVLRQRATSRLVLVECWNTFEDLGAAVRSSAWKLQKVDEEAIARLRPGDPRPAPAAGCWVVRATARNMAIVHRYPEIIAARFPGSSHEWVRALTAGEPPPAAPGLVWCDVATTRLYPLRRR